MPRLEPFKVDRDIVTPEGNIYDMTFMFAPMPSGEGFQCGVGASKSVRPEDKEFMREECLRVSHELMDERHPGLRDEHHASIVERPPKGLLMRDFAIEQAQRVIDHIKEEGQKSHKRGEDAEELTDILQTILDAVKKHDKGKEGKDKEDPDGGE